MKIRKHATIAAAALCTLLTLQALDAQSRKGTRRTSLTKKELEQRYENLQGELPALRSATDANERADAKRRAFDVVDKALNKELDNEIELEQKRLATDSDVDAHIRETEKSLKSAREMLPAEEAKRFDPAPRSVLVSAFGGQEAAASAEQEPDFDGFTAITPEGESFKVPGVDVAKTFDGKVVPVEGNGPAPGAKPGPVQEQKKKNKQQPTEITCTGEAVFSSTGSEKELPEGKEKVGPPIVIFKENVHVKHPEFTIDCDRLIAFMEDAEAKNGAADDEGGIKRVIATGREVTVIKRMPNGKVKIGKARKLTYDKATGDVILEDWPQVQDGDNVQIATRQDVVMTIKQDGRMVAKGPTKAVIVPKTGEDSPLSTE